MLTSEVAVVKSRHGISVKCSRHRDTGTTDPSLVLRDGYNLPFRERPHLSRFPLIVSKYASPVKSKALLEALASLIQKKAVEKVVVRSSLAFYNRLFLVPKPNNKWRPVLYLSTLNLFLETKTFKMETPEIIRLSLQQGEWVTSLENTRGFI